MATFFQLQQCISKIRADPNMEEAHFFLQVSESTFVCVWASKTEAMLDYTPFIGEARFLCSLKFSMLPINLRSETRLSIQSQNPYKLIRIDDASKPETDLTAQRYELSVGPNRCSRQVVFRLSDERGKFNVPAEFSLQGDLRIEGEIDQWQAKFFLVTK